MIERLAGRTRVRELVLVEVHDERHVQPRRGGEIRCIHHARRNDGVVVLERAGQFLREREGGPAQPPLPEPRRKRDDADPVTRVRCPAAREGTVRAPVERLEKQHVPLSRGSSHVSHALMVRRLEVAVKPRPLPPNESRGAPRSTRRFNGTS